MVLLFGRTQDFKGQITRLNLQRMRLVRAREALPRLGYATLPPGMVFLTFPADRASWLIYDGVRVGFGEFVLHSDGQRFFQRTAAPVCWGTICVAPADVSAFVRVVQGVVFTVPMGPIVLRPSRANGLRLLRLHAQSGRVAQADLQRATHPEVLRALEQELIPALAGGLETGGTEDEAEAWRHDSVILGRLEEVAQANTDRLLATAEFADRLGIPEAALEALCERALGMDAAAYQRRRNLERARAELADGGAGVRGIGDVAARHGFERLDQFITAYLETYGELPA